MFIMFNQICINEEMLPKYTCLNSMNLQFMNITALWNRNVISWRDKLVMYIQKLHHFCNTSSPDDRTKLGRKYLRNN